MRIEEDFLAPILFTTFLVSSCEFSGLCCGAKIVLQDRPQLTYKYCRLSTFNGSQIPLGTLICSNWEGDLKNEEQ